MNSIPKRYVVITETLDAAIELIQKAHKQYLKPPHASVALARAHVNDTYPLPLAARVHIYRGVYENGGLTITRHPVKWGLDKFDNNA